MEDHRTPFGIAATQYSMVRPEPSWVSRSVLI
jgi:hypothetical protein